MKKRLHSDGQTHHIQFTQQALLSDTGSSLFPPSVHQLWGQFQVGKPCRGEMEGSLHQDV